MQRTAERPRVPGLAPQWFGVAAGPLAWTAHTLLSYFFVTLACTVIGEAMATALIVGVTAGFALVALVGGLVAWRAWRRSGIGVQTDSDGALGRGGYLALSGVLLSAVFTLSIIVGGLGVFWLSPCGPGTR